MSDENSAKGILATTSVEDTVNGAARKPEDGKSSGKSYRAPASMLSALLIGLGLALAQHFLHTHLNGRPVSSVSASQAWISRISIGLAFAVKVALTICVGVAFVQYQWLSLRQRPFRVADIDSLTSALGNVLCLFESTLWVRNPALTFLAAVSWTIPLSTVVTPGSLSVQPVQNNSTIMLQTPQPLYNQSQTQFGVITVSNHVAQMTQDPQVMRSLTSTASLGTPVTLPSLFQNQSYSLQFYGPAVKCADANDTTILNATLKYGYTIDSESSIYFNTVYVAWTPRATQPGQPDYSFIDAARIFIMTNMGYRTTIVNATIDGHTTEKYMVNVTECLLYNATYHVDLEFKYPNLTLNITVERMNESVSMLSHDAGGGLTLTNEYTWPEKTSYLAMMSAFGHLLVGQATQADTSYFPGYMDNNSTGLDIIDIDWTRAEAIQHGLEQLFQSFTLSLLSDDRLIKNSSTAEYHPVKIETWPITYVYTQVDLFIAYGISLLAALICSAFGLYAFIDNDASYQNIFSTYLRATNTAGLDRYIAEDDKGHDPRPKTLKDIKVNISDDKLESE